MEGGLGEGGGGRGGGGVVCIFDPRLALMTPACLDVLLDLCTRVRVACV